MKAFDRQGVHLVAYLVLTALLVAAVRELDVGSATLGGLTATGWVALSWVFAGLSQLWVALFWRLELHGGHVSGRLGDAGFKLMRAGYVVVFSLRFLPLVPVAVLTAGTLPLPVPVSLALLLVTGPPIVWATFSALHYMGLDRLAGIDHFDPTYRTLGLETRGIYKYVSNVVYVVWMLVLFHPGLLWLSSLAMVTAAAHWALVWAHYHCTEKPDLEVIYGGAPTPTAVAG